MEKEIAQQLAEFSIQTRYEDIPKEVIDFTKGLTLKTVAGMVAGATKPSSRKMAGLIRDQNLPEGVGVLGSGFRTSLWESVFLNAYFAHAIELEDDRFGGGISWDITVIPLLFPLCKPDMLSFVIAQRRSLFVYSRAIAFDWEECDLFMRGVYSNYFMFTGTFIPSADSLPSGAIP